MKKRHLLDPAALAIYARLLRYVKRYWLVFLLAFAAMIIYSLTQTAFAALMKPLMNGGFVNRNPMVIRLIAGEILLLFFVRGLAGFTLNYSMSWIGRRVILALRSDLFRKLLNLPASFFDSNATGTLLSKLTYNTEQVAESTTNSVKVAVRDTVTVVALLGWMIYLNWLLTVLILVIVPLIAGLTTYVSRRFRKVSTRIQDSMGEISRTTEEVIAGHRMVKLYSAETAETARFELANQQNLRQNLKLAFTSAVANPVIQVIAGAGLALVLYVLTLKPFKAGNNVGDFASFLTAVTLLLPPLRRLTDVMAAVQRGIAAGESIFELLDLDSEQDRGTHTLAQVRGELCFRQVDFAYPSSRAPVLKNISFDLHPGERIALVGRSGSGKSTLASLVPRFYDPDGGRILIDGIDLRDVPLAELRRQIAMVTQNVILFNDTIAHNIAYGAPEGASEEAIREAARTARLLDEIEQLPEGFGTVVGERGLLLSGGQRQRLSIARALINNAPILVLDEATSALDSEAEQAVEEALDRLMSGRTTLVIAHRLTTVERANRILVLNQGRIVETGTHQELLESGGLYASLYRLEIRGRT